MVCVSAIDNLPTRWAECIVVQHVFSTRAGKMLTDSIGSVLNQIAAQVGRLQENGMKRLMTCLLLLPLLVGCRRNAAETDPFSVWGKSRIPPPATGSGTQDEYYRPGAVRPVPATATTGWKSVSRGDRSADVSGLADKVAPGNRPESADGDSTRSDFRRAQVVSR